MCPKPFSWAKNKRKLFSDGKSRGPLLARVALKKVNEKYFRLQLVLVPCGLTSLLSKKNNEALIFHANSIQSKKGEINPITRPEFSQLSICLDSLSSSTPINVAAFSVG